MTVLSKGYRVVALGGATTRCDKMLLIGILAIRTLRVFEPIIRIKRGQIGVRLWVDGGIRGGRDIGVFTEAGRQLDVAGGGEGGLAGVSTRLLSCPLKGDGVRRVQSGSTTGCACQDIGILLCGTSHQGRLPALTPIGGGLEGLTITARDQRGHGGFTEVSGGANLLFPSQRTRVRRLRTMNRSGMLFL
jgi:hypothetical protein